ncbi:hypothetical protein GCM10009087_43080 [Sphingomonas oligophenolica]|uniref:Aspartyl/asparaginyl beta-hydroxylase domain-containing protein n=1 Tax=Sphingomonas oligophenolica TaxID=301154 RepID=A0ABU9XZH7_9SPHN
MLDLPQQSPFSFADRVRLPFAFDVARMRADLEAVTEGNWVEHLVRQNYEGDWDVLPLRFTAGATHPVMQIYADPTATAFEDGPALDRTPCFREILARFQCPLQSVRLMRLTPGSVIKEHFDLDLAAEWGTARIHIPITTNPQVEFLLNQRRIVMEPGSAWYLRLSDAHSVANRGTTDRVHLVIDCIANEWLIEQLHWAS